MDRETCDRLYQNELTPKQKKVLHLFLADRTDEQIAAEIGANHRTTTCHHLKNISIKFGFLPETQPDFRCNLVELFARYKPELVTAKALEKCGCALPNLRFPEGPEPVNSPFYLERSASESDLYRALQEAGCLIRIKAPKQMGKTSLIKRIIDRCQQNNDRIVYLNFSLIDSEQLSSKEQFLRTFAAYVKNQLPDAPPLLEWDRELPIMVNCTDYFQTLLSRLDGAILLVLDEVDRLFEYPDLYRHFFPMLRYWSEQANESDIWEKLRLVVAHSTEDYGKLDINQSPFNIGLPIKLDDFEPEQVRNLVMRHGLDSQIAAPLGQLVGGHPYLIRLALYHLARHQMPIKQLLTEATTDSGIYSEHLQRHLEIFKEHPELGTVFQHLIAANKPVIFQQRTKEIYQLERMGLIKITDNSIEPRYRLYREYFRDRTVSVNCGLNL